MHDYSDREVLITGGAGFIGSWLARRLVALGAKVTIVDSLIPEYGGNLRNLAGLEGKVRLNITDIRDPHAMRYLTENKHVVFNLAGQTSHIDSMTDPFTDLDINAKSQLSLLESLRIHNPDAIVVYASTRQIYGRPERLPVDEDHPKRPVDVNGINKIAGEDYHLLYHQVYGIRSTALRLTNTYGPCMRIRDARQTFLGVWVRDLLQGKPIEVWGGEQLRDFNFVDDVVDAFLVAALEPKVYGHAFNLGSDEIVSLQDVATMLVDVAAEGRYEIREFPAERKKIDIGDYYSDYGRFNALTDWRPRVALADGLAKTLAYYRKESSHYL